MSVHQLLPEHVGRLVICLVLVLTVASEDNCHPWIFDKLMVSANVPSGYERDPTDAQWMHNGEISGFTKIKRALQASLSEELFLYPSGYTGKGSGSSPSRLCLITDSEWAFMVFLSHVCFSAFLHENSLTTVERPPRALFHAQGAPRRHDGDSALHQLPS